MRETSSKRSGDFERYAIILLPAIGKRFSANFSTSFTAVTTCYMILQYQMNISYFAELNILNCNFIYTYFLC